MISRRGLRYVMIYLAIVALAALPLLFGGSELGGVVLVIVTLPWSVFAVFTIDAIDPKLMDRWYTGFVVSIVGTVLNSAFLYGLALTTDRRSKALTTHDA